MAGPSVAGTMAETPTAAAAATVLVVGIRSGGLIGLGMRPGVVIPERCGVQLPLHAAPPGPVVVILVHTPRIGVNHDGERWVFNAIPLATHTLVDSGDDPALHDPQRHLRVAENRHKGGPLRGDEGTVWFEIRWKHAQEVLVEQRVAVPHSTHRPESLRKV